MMKYILCVLMNCFCCALLSFSALAQDAGIDAGVGVRGRVLSGDKPVAGASVVLVGSTYGTVTDSAGRFALAAPAGIWHLRVSFVGLVTQERAVRLPVAEAVVFALLPSDNVLSEVTVSTGYQTLAKERATGSFAVADRKLLERSVSTDVIDRLRDVVPGVSFNNQGTRISVRGQSTLFSNAEPLIVVDNFPYNQPVENLNPNDVESVTVLKDAAAASVWGARAGNGVIVITTKRGRNNMGPQLSFSSNVTVGAKPDLLSVPRMSAADYTGLERRLFSEGYFEGAEQSDSHLPLSPVAELLAAARDGALSSAEADRQIAALSGYDVRRDELRYLYRPSVKQQYALSLSGGSGVQRYYVSAGADKNTENAAGNRYDRVTLNANNTWSLIGGRLEASLGMAYTRSNTVRDALGSLTWNRGQRIYPYARLADEAGNALPLVRDLRSGFADAAPGAGLLDWSYVPLNERGAYDRTTVLNEVRINTGLKYKLLPGLSAQILYQYDRGATTGRDLSRAGSYYARNLINRYTQDDGSGTLTRAVPEGGVLDLSDGSSVAQNLRGQLDYGLVRGKNEWSLLAGWELQSQRVRGSSYRLYGYDEEHATAVDADMRTLYTFYDDPGQQGVLLSNTALSDAVDNYRSYYANAGYTYDGRLTFSASARKDQSNLFGVRSNQKGVPLYSLGAAWEVSKEGFYKLKGLSQLRLRTGFGYNGNVNKSLSAYTTASYFDGSEAFSQLPYARIINPPNPELRWERVQHINLGLDFGLFAGRISGTFEYFFKKGTDLIGSSAMAPSSGVLTFTGNVADTRGRGFDLSLQSRNLTGRFSWTTDFLMSRVRDVVTHYERPSPAGSYLESGDQGRYALEGKPLYAVYSYRSAGLDPATGDPQGYLNGAVSKDYAAILSAATPDGLVFNGSSRPEVFGALRNTFGYGPLELSFNISYKLGYYYRRPSVVYGTDHGLAQQSGDFALRWQQPGDEAHTVVPSMPAGTNFQRDLFYRYSSALVEKGDHVRLQDLRLAWTFEKGSLSFLPKGGLQIYLYASNLGILWRANRSHTDPDAINTYSLPKTLSAGVRLNLN
ncbi:SusC/RagA family TonB-linked outer membrane protein [Mucilaginibacter conchicola]|uniref:SusC/RagA family TonB-linked outer membrane protein n=1 Tax=Mucilaginibacter conchicola TaxID=2303333 RepID=A0A372NV13_9SPHI|nr:SusC/RagA family TonB-linked outer membrane protein [Mucilaginibacter conchicola]RFZ92874.1 SusC/RagA family TonB-linked outer membrane protein [Mucilaginibacter conchicola]